MEKCKNCYWLLGTGKCGLKIENKSSENENCDLWKDNGSTIIYESDAYLKIEVMDLKIALAKMWFAYINKDEDNPHDYEFDALSCAKKMLGNYKDAMKLIF